MKNYVIGLVGSFFFIKWFLQPVLQFIWFGFLISFAGYLGKQVLESLNDNHHETIRTTKKTVEEKRKDGNERKGECERKRSDERREGGERSEGDDGRTGVFYPHKMDPDYE